MSSILTHPNVNRQESFVINPHHILQLYHLVQARRYSFMGHEYLLFSIFYMFRPSWPSSQAPFSATKSPSKSLRILKRITRNTDQPAYSVVQSSPSGANRSSADREISPNFMEHEGLLPLSQQPATCSYPKPDRSSLCPISLLEDPF
jgi:hypothetical protein